MVAVELLLKFTLMLLVIAAVVAVVVILVLALSIVLSFTVYPLYCAPYWWYAGNKRCDGWYQSDGLPWHDAKKATYIYYCWITHKKTPED